VVSSTKIRELVAEGRVAAAARLLGRPFDLTGRVVKGAGRGRSIGFATANLVSTNEVRPGIGVYAVRAQIGEQVFGGAANLGCKPTFGESEMTIEVHLFDFEGDLYGATVRVAFLDRLRGEQRFASVAELAEQIRRDCEKARQVLARSVFP
jgi:riboflavin kinase/FMN adenylyltransferase